MYKKSEPLYFEEYSDAVAALQRGEFVTVTARGLSLRPFFSLGRDSLVLAPIKNCEVLSDSDEEIIDRHNRVPRRKRKNSSQGEDRMTLRRRDIVLFRYRDTATFRLLRVVHVWGTLLLLRGDGCYAPYERATVSDVVGIVVKGTCFGGTPFVATSRLWRFISKTWTASYRFRLWVRRLFRKK